MREVLILQGSGRDSQGNLWHPGERRQNVRIDSLLAYPGPDLIALIVRAVPTQLKASARPFGERLLPHHGSEPTAEAVGSDAAESMQNIH